MSNLRKIGEFQLTNGNYTKVYRNAEWNEYVVKFYNHQCIYMDGSDYHTSDRQDAFDTAQSDI